MERVKKTRLGVKKRQAGTLRIEMRDSGAGEDRKNVGGAIEWRKRKGREVVYVCVVNRGHFSMAFL